MGTLKLIIAFLLISSTLFAQNGSITIKIPNTGSSGVGSVSSGAYYNVKNYGAVANGITNNTTAIQSAINAAHAAGGGIVYLPTDTKGVYLTNKLTTYIDVTIIGDGRVGDTLRSITADTLISLNNTDASGNSSKYWTNPLVSGVCLDAGTLGTVGFFVNGIANFIFEKTTFNGFKTMGLLLKNSLIGVVNNCYFYNCYSAIKAYNGGGNLNATNLVTMNSVVINGYTKWGIDWQGGGHLTLNTINIENGGTSNDTLSGCIYYHDNRWPLGLTVNSGWFENNLGTEIYIADNVTNFGSGYPTYTVHSINSLLASGQSFTFTKRNLAIKGDHQRLNIRSSYITGAINAVVADGADNIVKSDSATIYNATNILRAGATFSTY